jgi:putative tryptophan/tyrosine transport system substrate-binding protein
MQRRAFLTLLSGAVVWPRVATAQPAHGRPLIAYLAGGDEATATTYINMLQKGLRELGYVDGTNMDFAARFAAGYVERLPRLAEELVKLNPAIIVPAGVDATVAARKITASIPIVAPVLADPIQLGLVASYNHPGGNVTGIMPYVEGLPGKQMELAREVVPGARVVGALGNLNDPKAVPQLQELVAAARVLGIELVAPEVRVPEDLDAAVQALAASRVEVVIVLQTTMNLVTRRKIALLMAANRLPAVYGYREHIDEGGVISYGINLRWCYYHAAVFVQKILTGTAPGDLPVEFPSRIEMAVNIKAATAIGLKVPETLLVRADEVVE